MVEENRWWLWTPPEGGSIGKTGLRRKDGVEKASGKAIYCRDVNRPGQLYAKQLLSPYAHAKITSIDYSAAEAMPGVRTILKWDDADIKDLEIFEQFPREKRWFEIIEDSANWYPAPVGPVVVADTELICDEALRLIKITWEEQPFILDPEKALESGATILRPDKNPDNNIEIEITSDVGSVEAGFAESKNIIEFTVRRDQEDVWAGVESQSAVAEWGGDFLDVWHHSQHPTEVSENLNKLLGIPISKINIHTPYHGGTFGGQTFLQQGSISALLATIAAKRLGRPVKFLYDKSHFAGNEEQYGYYKFKVGYNDDGVIKAVDLTTYYTAQTVHDQLVKITECTGIPNYHIHDIQPYLSKGQPVCYKHGGPACTVHHQVFGHVAAALNMNPQDLARINDGIEAGVYMDSEEERELREEQGFPEANSLEQVIETGNELAEWDINYHEPGAKILSDGKYHGMGWTWIIHWSHGMGGGTNPGITIQPDGTARILARRSDMGVDAESTYCRVVADEMGMKYDDVDCRPFDELPGFEHTAGGGSSGTAANLPSLIVTARAAKQDCYNMLPLQDRQAHAALFPDKTADNLILKTELSSKRPIRAIRRQWQSVTSAFWKVAAPEGFQHAFLLQGKIRRSPSVNTYVSQDRPTGKLCGR
jgi:CO/xanthine dehydrogenase Mo-binding subunit